ncbi:unnamed protein product [Echinostoma caproni]|uniref:Similar to n=1 Tax=Echinostoma caproni TaxID=27848 RepID=A0A183A7D5_9TREM|nr:unnamed protein product [Echinostoma caproni]
METPQLHKVTQPTPSSAAPASSNVNPSHSVQDPLLQWIPSSISHSLSTLRINSQPPRNSSSEQYSLFPERGFTSTPLRRTESAQLAAKPTVSVDENGEQLELVNPHPVLRHAEEDPIETHDQVVAEMAAQGIVWAPPNVMEPRNASQTADGLSARNTRWYSAGIEEEQLVTQPSPNHWVAEDKTRSGSDSYFADGSKQTGRSKRYTHPSGAPQAHPNSPLSQSSTMPPDGVSIEPLPSIPTSRDHQSISEGDVQSRTLANDLTTKTTDTLTQVNDAGHRDLKARLDHEIALRKQQDDYIRQLQKYYDNLLTKHALAEVTIDQLRMGSKVRSESEDRTNSRANTHRASDLGLIDRSARYQSQPLSALPNLRRGSQLFGASNEQLVASGPQLRYASTPMLVSTAQQQQPPPRQGRLTESRDWSTTQTSFPQLTEDPGGNSRAGGSGVRQIDWTYGNERYASSERLCQTVPEEGEPNYFDLNKVDTPPSSADARMQRRLSNSTVVCKPVKSHVTNESVSTETADQRPHDAAFSLRDRHMHSMNRKEPEDRQHSVHPKQPTTVSNNEVGLGPDEVHLDLMTSVMELKAKLDHIRLRIADHDDALTESDIRPLRAQYIQLKKCYHLARRRWCEDSKRAGTFEFDSSQTLDKELFQLRLQLDDIEACLQLTGSPMNEPNNFSGKPQLNDSYVRNFPVNSGHTIGSNSKYPTVVDSGVLSSPSRSDREHDLSSVSSSPLVKGKYYCSLRAVELTAMNWFLIQCSSYILFASWCVRALTYNLRALEDLYVDLMDRYNKLKECDASHEQATRLYDIMKRLYDLAITVNGHSSVIPTPEELESVFQLDGDTRKLSEDLEKMIRTERELSAYSSYSNVSGRDPYLDPAQPPVSNSGHTLNNNKSHHDPVPSTSGLTQNTMTFSNRGFGTHQPHAPGSDGSSSAQDSGLSTPPVSEPRSCRIGKLNGSREQRLVLESTKRRMTTIESDSSPTAKSIPTYSTLGHPSDSGLPGSFPSNRDPYFVASGAPTSKPKAGSRTVSAILTNSCAPVNYNAASIEVQPNDDDSTKKRMEAIEAGIRFLQEKMQEVCNQRPSSRMALDDAPLDGSMDASVLWSEPKLIREQPSTTNIGLNRSRRGRKSRSTVTKRPAYQQSANYEQLNHSDPDGSGTRRDGERQNKVTSNGPTKCDNGHDNSCTPLKVRGLYKPELIRNMRHQNRSPGDVSSGDDASESPENDGNADEESDYTDQDTCSPHGSDSQDSDTDCLDQEQGVSFHPCRGVKPRSILRQNNPKTTAPVHKHPSVTLNPTSHRDTRHRYPSFAFDRSMSAACDLHQFPSESPHSFQPGTFGGSMPVLIHPNECCDAHSASVGHRTSSNLCPRHSLRLSELAQTQNEFCRPPPPPKPAFLAEPHLVSTCGTCGGSGRVSASYVDHIRRPLMPNRTQTTTYGRRVLSFANLIQDGSILNPINQTCIREYTEVGGRRYTVRELACNTPLSGPNPFSMRMYPWCSPAVDMFPSRNEMHFEIESITAASLALRLWCLPDPLTEILYLD